MKYIVILLTSLFLLSNASAGEIDGKGLVCGPVGYFFNNDLHSFHHVRNGELRISDEGKYSTTPKRINVKSLSGDYIIIARETPVVYYNNNGYDCKLAIGYPSFMEMLKTNLENIKKNNKI